MWDVGNFLLDPSSEGSGGDQQQQREDDQDSNKDDTKKEPKVNCQRTLSLQIFICAICPPFSLDYRPFCFIIKFGYNARCHCLKERVL